MDLSTQAFVFIVGAPRSGTTWLQRILAAHPEVAAIEQELTLFSRYVAPLIARYKNESSKIENGRWEQGLPLVLNREGLDAWIEQLIHKTYEPVLNENTTATTILDKHPNYAQYLDVIAHYLPNAKVIHLIRDGRDVAVSMMSVNQRLGHSPGEIKEAAALWKRFISNARRSDLAKTEAYMEIRYEDMLSHGEDLVPGILKFLGLSSEEEVLRKLTDEELFNKRVSAPNTNLDTKRASTGGSWESELTVWQRHTFDRLSGDLLVDLGYAEKGWWEFSFIDRVHLFAISKIKRLKASLRGFIRGIIDHPD